MRRLAVIAVALWALAASALAHAASPQIARPDPVTYPVRIDYSSPLPMMQPLERASIAASTRDRGFLAYKKIDDLGGFMPAPIGAVAFLSGARDLLWAGRQKTQIPLFAQAAGGEVLSFTFATQPSGPTPPPDNGNRPGVTPPVPPTPKNVVPPANQGFGGGGTTSGSGDSGTTTPRHRGGGSTTTTRRPPTTTTTTAPPTTTTTKIEATTTAATTPGITSTTGGGGSGCTGGTCTSGLCGAPGIDVTSSAPGCTIVLTNAAPGGSVQETLTIKNTTGAPYALSVEAGGLNGNHLWQDLQMEVYDATGSAPPFPWPLLTTWLGAYHALTMLNAGQSVQYVVALYLPTTAGNADQSESAVISFTWQAQG